ncbi:MAG: FIST N-terminal domain-containing protein [Candidatus Omnitrophota bacterium]
MDTKIGIGISTKLDSSIAGREAAQRAFYQLGRQDPDIAIVFISTIFSQVEAINGIRSILSDIPLVGCSTAGSITSLGYFRNSITVCAISSDSIKFSYGIGKNISKNSRLAGSIAAKQSAGQKDISRQAYIMFSDALSGNGTDILRGAQEVLGTGFPIIGGFASDDLLFQKTYQYLDNTIYTNSVVGLLISGNININIGKAHGWQPIGRPHKVTRARSNIVKEIDRRKAVWLYEEYLGKGLDELAAEGIGKLGSSYPLGIQIKEQKEYLMRSPLKIEDSGSLIFTAEIPEHQDINLMIGDKDLALDAAKEACIKALTGIKKSSIRFAIVFSDIARLQLLRNDYQNELAIIKDMLGPGVPFFGCYTYGEYAPIDVQGYRGQSYFYNQVISIAVFSE